MVVIEVNKQDTEVIEELRALFGDDKQISEDSFLSGDIVSFIVPIITALAASPVLIKWIDAEKLTIKYDKMEINGRSDKVLLALKELQDKEENDD